MEEIEKHNCAGLCSEQYCNKPETHFIQVKINEMEIFLSFCEKHAQIFENKILEGYLKK